MDISQIEKYEDKFKLRITEVEKKTSQIKEDGTGGNPMLVLDLEFIDNAPMRVFDSDLGEKVEVNPNGFRVRHWVVFTPKTIGSVNAFLKSIGMPAVKSNDEALGLDGNQFVGKVLDAWVKFKTRELKNSNGEVQLHNGKPITTGEIRIDKFLPAN
jgi:hypothetical protein